jgi:hypothetical protein
MYDSTTRLGNLLNILALREGDILETLKEPEGLPEQVDLLLLDSE